MNKSDFKFHFSSPVRKVALLGTALPRRCGIATFAADLAFNLASCDPDLVISSIAMNDRVGYEYPEIVAFAVDQSDPSAYLRAAEYINGEAFDVLSVQHEYGIFGGASGSYLMNLVREVKMPIVTTLHTVLRDPSASQKLVMDELLQLSERVVVMSQKAVTFLTEVHNLSAEKIDLIPHGIPDIPATAGQNLREELNIDGPMILTFGLLSPDKGVQYVIEAMPAIVRDYPGATYVIVGATHPNIQDSAGETYREGLVRLASELGVSQNVRFVNRFVTSDELIEYLGAMDIYVTPYLNAQQITSGTLAYAVGSGKAVISTPYWYAEELLDAGRGVLVPFRDSKAIGDAVLNLEGDRKARNEMGKRAAKYGRQMLWPSVSNRYLTCFSRAKSENSARLKELLQVPSPRLMIPQDLPSVRLDHLMTLSDDTGILQHATHTIPNRKEGYCVDDNARALLLTTFLEQGRSLSPEVALLQSRYLSFVFDAYNPLTGQFRNFLAYDRTWLEEAGSEDSQGRSLWALGAVVHRSKSESRKIVAHRLFKQAMRALEQTTSPRTWAYGILAADEFLAGFPLDHEVKNLMSNLTDLLLSRFKINQAQDWIWFEQSLSYANARLPQALLLAGQTLGRPELLQNGLESLRWLMKVQTDASGRFAPIGTERVYIKNSTPSMFDQQPIEAWASISACLSAYRTTSDLGWFRKAQVVFEWFLGENVHNQPLYDEASAGCHDGLHPDRVNQNEGAESTLSFLCALLEMRSAAVWVAPSTTKTEMYEFK